MTVVSFFFICYNGNIFYVTYGGFMAVVEIPKLPPLKAVLSGKSYWLATFKNVSRNGVSTPVAGTKSVGKVLGNSKTGLIAWKPDFIARFPLLEQLDTYREIDTSGKPSKLTKYKLVFKPKEELLSLTTACTLRRLAAGATWALDHIIAATPLTIALQRTFGKYRRDRKLLAVAYYMYLEQSSSLHRYASFAARVRLPYPKPLDSGQLSRLLSSITQDEINRFLSCLNQLIVKQEHSDVGTPYTYYALDSTSLSTHARKVAQARFGYNKDGDDLKQINVLMLVNQHTGLPLYYKAYDGDIPDVSTLSFVLKEFARLDMNRRAIVVSDKGYSSVLNIHRFLQTETSFLLNLKTSYSFCKHLIAEHLTAIKAISSFNRTYRNYMYTTTIQWSYPLDYLKVAPGKRRPHLKHDLYVHFIFDEHLYQEAKARFIYNLALILDKLTAGEELSEIETALKDKYLKATVTSDGNTAYTVNTHEQAQYLLTKGFQILLSDTITTAAEAKRAYLARLSVEQSFNVFKQQVGGRRLRTASNATTNGKIFALFLSASIALMFKSHIAYCKFKGFDIPFDNDRAILDTLNLIEATVFKDGVYYSPVTGKKRELLEALDIPKPTKEVALDTQADGNEEELEDENDFRDDEYYIESDQGFHSLGSLLS